jgi:hypothetical protein
MVTAAPTRIAAGISIVALLAVGAAACTAHKDPNLPSGSYRLVAFDSCADALAGLRTATKASVGPYGLYTGGGLERATGGAVTSPGSPPAPAAASGSGMASDKANTADGAQSPAYSGTNVQEHGVDEPDIVKTDGRRIVTLSNGRLNVVDVATRRLIGVVDLLQYNIGYAADLLLAGDHALVLGNGYRYGGLVETPMAGANSAAPNIASPAGGPPQPMPVQGANLVLVDLATPRVLSSATADGSIVDARQVGDTARIVVASAPRLAFPNTSGTDVERLAANRAAIDASNIDAWAPRLEVTTGGTTVRTQVGCDAISRPASSSYSGTNLLTVLTVDANNDALDDGHPVSIVADGNTVYSNGSSLYVASDESWPMMVPQLAPAGVVSPAQPRTEIYRFDTTTTPPRFTGGGSVPGRLINQYAMSEWDGYLRVAATTTAVKSAGAAVTTQSGVYVLHPDGGQLRQVGSVEGLGTGEQIYAVRFVGPAGYVVTFRQTDPLYTVDLRDPTAPVVRGELKLSGYSAYLHPVGSTQLIGVGQDATSGGHATGTQVSLFDVTDLSAPARLANYTLHGTYSEAQFDPHAFLYWPQGAGGLVVVPIQNPYGVVVPGSPGGGPAAGGGSTPAPPSRVAGPTATPAMAPSGALVLRVEANQIVEAGFVTHPGSIDNYYGTPITRSLITTDGAGHTTLWTVSAGGIMATDADSFSRLAWLPW